MAKWQFYDPSVPETYTFDINPNTDGTPAREKNFTFQNTSAVNGKTIVMEGRENPRTGSFSGVLLEEAQLNAFDTWFSKRNQIRVTDDLGREFWILISAFRPTRVFTTTHPWKHNYEISYTIVDWS